MTRSDDWYRGMAALEADLHVGAGRMAMPPSAPGKGEKGGKCNVTACANVSADHWNKSTKAYYCRTCADAINWPGGRADVMKLYGVPLLCELDKPCVLSDDKAKRAIADCTRNVYRVSVDVSDGCKMSEGEYTLEITEILKGAVGEEDFRLVDEAVINSGFSLNEEEVACLLLCETGEQEGFGWHRYYEVVGMFTPILTYEELCPLGRDEPIELTRRSPCP